jgi:hypothetical protein
LAVGVVVARVDEAAVAVSARAWDAGGRFLSAGAAVLTAPAAEAEGDGCGAAVASEGSAAATAAAATERVTVRREGDLIAR